MKDLIKKQEEEFDNLFVGVEDDGTFKRIDEVNIRDFVAKVRKETVEYVCDKMIGTTLEERSDFFNFNINKIEKRFFIEGYNQKLKKEEEIKKQILKELL